MFASNPLSLNPYEMESLLINFETSVRVRKRHQLYLWAQGALQGFLPHETLLCGMGYATAGSLRTEISSRALISEEQMTTFFNVDGNAGFAYLFLLFALAVVGLLLASFGQNWRTTAQREREAELLFIGKQFSQALESYRASTKAGAAEPASLDELLEDKRFPFTVRHLRQIPRDPMTGKRDWQVQIREGRIVGIHSRSSRETWRKRLPDYVAIPSDATETTTYQDWLFVAREKDDPGAALAKSVASRVATGALSASGRQAP